MQIITNQFQKELKQHGNEQFPFLVSYQKLQNMSLVPLCGTGTRK